ncbi:hypothetical protein GCM10020295_46110 [Streptomyces cinereospinus]
MKHSTTSQTRRGQGPARRIGRSLALVLPVFLVLSGTLAVTRVNWSGDPESSVLTAAEVSASGSRTAPRAPHEVLRDQLLTELQRTDPGTALTHLQQAVDERPSLGRHCASLARALGRAASASTARRVPSPTPAPSATPRSPRASWPPTADPAAPACDSPDRPRRAADGLPAPAPRGATPAAGRPPGPPGSPGRAPRTVPGMTDPNAAARPVQAVILAGGQGSRLRPYTDDRPKPMVEIPGTGTPIIGHQLTWLAEEGVTDVVISCGHLAEVLQEWLDSADLPVRVTTVVETEPLGAAAA